MQRFLDLFISINCSACFRRSLRPSLGAQYCTYSVRYCKNQYCCLLLIAAGSRYHGWHGTPRYGIQVLATLARNHSTSSSAVNVRPLDFCLHRHPVSVNCLYHARIVLSVGASFAYFARNARCTVTTDLLVWYSNTQNSSPGAAIFSLHTLVSPSSRNVNYDQKQLIGG